MIDEATTPAMPANASPGERRDIRLARLVRATGFVLLAVDVGSLALLVSGLGAPWWLAIGLGAGIGGATTYQAQWRFLLSRDAFARRRSVARHARMAGFVLAVNLWGGYLVTQGLFYTYLAMRALTALLVVRGWGIGRLSAREAAGEADPEGA